MAVWWQLWGLWGLVARQEEGKGCNLRLIGAVRQLLCLPDEGLRLVKQGQPSKRQVCVAHRCTRGKDTQQRSWKNTYTQVERMLAAHSYLFVPVLVSLAPQSNHFNIWLILTPCSPTLLLLSLLLTLHTHAVSVRGVWLTWAIWPDITEASTFRVLWVRLLRINPQIQHTAAPNTTCVLMLLGWLMMGKHFHKCIKGF